MGPSLNNLTIFGFLNKIIVLRNININKSFKISLNGIVSVFESLKLFCGKIGRVQKDIIKS